MDLTFPPIYLLPTHIPLDLLHELEDKIPTLTYDITEAKVVLGKVTTKQRAQFELRSRNLWTEEVVKAKIDLCSEVDDAVKDRESQDLPRKRRKTDAGQSKDVIVVDSSTEPEDDTTRNVGIKSPRWTTPERAPSHSRSPSPAPLFSSPKAPMSQASLVTSLDSQSDPERDDIIKVARLPWFTDSLAAGRVLSLESYIVYEGKQIRRPDSAPQAIITKIVKRPKVPEDIWMRAKADAPKTAPAPFSKGGHVKASDQHEPLQHPVTRPTHLLHQTTSEHDNPAKFPPIPDYLHNTYSCQRPTPLYSPNDPFIGQLKKIKLTRILTDDEIGVRAYSTAIASLAAYPHTLTSAQEVLHLPGCDQKIALLYQEWKDTGHIRMVDDLESEPMLQVLNLFYEIWGVGATTAREFYGKGWRDLDDVVEYGWSTLSRVQQIGVKYYDEFQQKIPRTEVEFIGNTILEHANKLCPGWQMVIVGGYRRGKPESGDVDVILSHPDENVTCGAVQDIVSELEKTDWITHTLTLSMANSERGQMPVSWKRDNGKRGTGFDTLDKALVVWQDPSWPTRDEDLEMNAKAKNPNVHRRVDIIISPWKTAGCAVLGWTSGTTFQRDMRRFCKNIKNLKFDSSGIRSRDDGHWVDFEGGDETTDLLSKEKKVFAGLGLEWREPGERCTG